MLKVTAMITVGAFIQGMAMGLFLFPHYIPSGGAGGLGVLINYLLQLPISFALWLVNFSLLVVAMKGLGNASALGTMYAITVTSLAVDLFSFDVHITYAEPWLDLVIGAVFLGIGIGILMRNNVSNGGIGVIALILAKHRDLPPGKALFWMNGFIFVIMSVIIDWNLIFLSISCQWISTKIVDIIYRLKLPMVIGPDFAWRRKS